MNLEEILKKDNENGEKEVLNALIGQGMRMGMQQGAQFGKNVSRRKRKNLEKKIEISKIIR